MTFLTAALISLLFAPPAQSPGYPAYQKANALFVRQQFPAALASVEEALTLDPKLVPALTLKAKLAMAGNRLDVARKSLEQAITADPKSQYAQFLYGLAAYLESDIQAALPRFRAAHQMNPSDPRAALYLGLSTESLGDTAAALALYEEAVRLEKASDSLQADTLLPGGRLLLLMGRLDDSETWLRQALALAPKIRDTHFEIARLCLLQGDAAQAAAEGEKALALTGGITTDAQIHYLLIRAWRQSGNVERSARHAEAAAGTGSSSCKITGFQARLSLMPQIQGPAIFLAQFLGDTAPYNSLPSITSWVKSLGYAGVQIPSWDGRVIDIKQAAESKAYCDDIQGQTNGLAVTELASHLQGQLVASHPAYDELFDGFAAPEVQGNPKARAEWAVQQMKYVIQASANMGLTVTPSFSGALLWPFLYPWPQRPAGIVEEGFAELAKRWKPILDFADQHGVDIAYELHPGEDLHDGASFEQFLKATGNHPRVAINYDPSHFVLQCMDYVGFIDVYGSRIKAFHVKDAEFRPSARSGVYGAYLGWKDRPGRFRSLGDGQVDFTQVFTRMTAAGYSSWAVLEWECCYKDSVQGATEGAPFIAKHLIDVPTKAFDDFAGAGSDTARNRRVLGLG